MKKIIILLLVLTNLYLVGFAQTDTIRITKDTVINRYRAKDPLLIIDISKAAKVVLNVETFKTKKKTAMRDFFERLSLRQSFQSTNDKAKDAFVNLVYPKDSVSSQNFSFALGVNMLRKKSPATLQPFIEWQKNTLIAKKQNTFQAGFTFQTPLWPVLDPKKDWTIFLVSTANYKNDNVKSTEGSQVSAYFTPVFNGKNDVFYFLPDADMKNEAIKVNYNLYAGLEFEDRARVSVAEQKGTVWRGYLRITGKIYPLPELLDERLEIVPDYVYRNAFSKGTSAEEKVNKLWTLSFNLVLLKKTKSGIADVKIGFDHVHGTDPTVGFEKQQVNTLTLKVKI